MRIYFIFRSVQLKSGSHYVCLYSIYEDRSLYITRPVKKKRLELPAYLGTACYCQPGAHFTKYPVFLAGSAWSVTLCGHRSVIGILLKKPGTSQVLGCARGDSILFGLHGNRKCLHIMSGRTILQIVMSLDQPRLSFWICLKHESSVGKLGLSVDILNCR